MIDNLLNELGFAPAKYIKGRSSIADLFKPGERHGIYVLHFGNNEFYAGKAIDVSRRYIQHCATHKDIDKISFKPTYQDELDEVEQAVIRQLEQNHISLRNIVFTNIPKVESDFDLIMSSDEQSDWINSLHATDFQGVRLVDPELRRKFRIRYEKFSKDEYAHTIIESLKTYISVGIPVARRSEVAFWALSCGQKVGEVFSRKSTGDNSVVAGWQSRIIYSRVNVNWQEVFTAFAYDGQLWFSIHLSRSPLENVFGELLWKYPKIDNTDHKYNPGGQDQTSFDVPIEVLKPFLTEPSVILAIRSLNLRLMKKGACAYGRFHCMDLADKVLELP